MRDGISAKRGLVRATPCNGAADQTAESAAAGLQGVARHRHLASVGLFALRVECRSLPGVLARLRLLDRVVLTPEGITFEEQRRLTRAMLRRGYRVFSFTFHSPSLVPGNTPYVRDAAQLQSFLRRIEQYLEFFMTEIGGRAATPFEIKEGMSRLAATSSPSHGGLTGPAGSVALAGEGGATA